ncbi:MAG: hypothetical protein GY744_00045 [Gammaproteobacteria bacterium]|nr:hypothetical protein [Gammaproteobacteria bacterium]
MLTVDDSPEVHDLTKLVLHNFSFDGWTIDFISAYSGAESISLLKQHQDIALILLDVVMETDQTGLNLVPFGTVYLIPFK